jgi:glycosyltransferase involved in cell wall biosynthesis
VRVLVASTFAPFVEGGGQIIVRDLAEALERRGHEVDTIAIPASGRWDTLLEQTLAMRLLEVGRDADALIALRPPSYALRHPDKRLWFIHHHRTAYDLWNTAWSDFPAGPAGVAARDAVRAVDERFLGEARRAFAISANVAERLRRFNGIEADVLHPPLGHPERFHWAAPEDYVLLHGRMIGHKRPALAVAAAAHLASDARVVVAGVPHHPGELAALVALVREHGLERRVTLIPRWIDESEKAELIARSLAVVHIPYDEDYGYVTLEAQHARKAVITCSDSGGPLEFVADGESGLVVAPDPRALAGAIDRLRADPASATAFGAKGHEQLERKGIGWDRVVEGLLS